MFNYCIALVKAVVRDDVELLRKISPFVLICWTFMKTAKNQQFFFWSERKFNDTNNKSGKLFYFCKHYWQENDRKLFYFLHWKTVWRWKFAQHGVHVVDFWLIFVCWNNTLCIYYIVIKGLRKSRTGFLEIWNNKISFLRKRFPLKEFWKLA